MKKSIIVLLLLISANFLNGQNKFTEELPFSESKVFKLDGKWPKVFYFNDGTSIFKTSLKDKFSIKYFDSSLGLVKEKEMSFGEKKKSLAIEYIIKKENVFYFFTHYKEKKNHAYSLIKCDLNLNIISEKQFFSARAEFGGKEFNTLAAKEYEKNNKHMSPVMLKFFNNNNNFKIWYMVKEQIHVAYFDIELNKKNEFVYTDEKEKYSYANLTTLFSISSQFSSEDGTSYSVYRNGIKHTAKEFIRAISPDGSIKTSETGLKINKKITDYELVVVKDEIILIVPTAKNSKTYINNLNIITYNKSDLTIKSNKFIPLKSKPKLLKNISIKSLQKGNNIYLAIETIKNSKTTYAANGATIPLVDYGNVYIYNLNLESKTLEWETKVNKKNEKVYQNTQNERHTSFSWLMKNDDILLFLNSNNKRTNNVFITKEKYSLLDSKVKTSGLYALKINKKSGNLSYKKIKDTENVIFYTNEGILKNNSLNILGENRKENLLQILKF